MGGARGLFSLVKYGPFLNLERHLSTKIFKFSEIGEDSAEPDLQPLPELDPPPKSSTQGGAMMKYIISVTKQYPQAVVMTQVGSFYELYFDHALEFGPKLDFKVAQKRQFNPITGTNSIPMIGFPLSQLVKYSTAIVQDWGKNVVVLSQQPDQVLKKSSEQLKRPVSRIVTPGTIIDEEAVDTCQQNFICCVYASTTEPEDPAAVAWVDLGDGSIYFQDTCVADLRDAIDRINPREVVIDAKSPIKLDTVYVSRHQFPLRDSVLQYRFMIDAPEKSLRSAIDQASGVSKGATSALLSYLNEVMPNTLHKFKQPQEYVHAETMQMDKATVAALELFKTNQRNSREGSLFSTIRKTVTPAGSRLLQQYLTEPSRNPDVINWRLDMVDLFRRESSLLDQTVSILQLIPDGKRVIQKLGSPRPNPQELLKWAAMADYVQIFSTVWKEHIPGWSNVLNRAVTQLLPIAKQIHRMVNTVVELEEPTKRTDMRNLQLLVTPNATPKMKQLEAEKQALIAQFGILASTYKTKFARYGDASIRYNPLNGYYCSLGFKNDDWKVEMQQHMGAILTQTRRTVSFTAPDIQDLGSAYETCLRKLDQTQNTILEKLRQKVLEAAQPMRECLEIIEMADVFQGFAKLAIERDFCRPKITETPMLRITGGRNLTVESGLAIDGLNFTENDTEMDPESPVVMVTGPNMGGKSTYIRQVALISLLAQVGSFVPAKAAEIGVIDRIFCRIGSGDDISRGRSTFLVEMMETSNIIRLATSQSLALLDEVGRGTSENDGIAIAYSTIKHMLQVNKCRALFSTHYGPELYNALKLNDLDGNVKFFKTQPLISNDTISYDHKLVAGVCSEAHGLEMAQLAGFPYSVMERAQSVYKSLE